ncbi:MAG: ABC transporter ATP-binding protein [Oscillospiraceae bacterium]|nr:ABC transporter ATP-binding protein [Oscillospiraceae bacterium]
MNNAIEIKNLCKTYPSFSLKDVNITLPKGYIMGYVGANGAGKSTTIASLLGLVRADSGSCLIDGRDIRDMSKEEKSRIGVVLDECNFPETLTWKQVDKFMKKIYSAWNSEKFCDMCRRWGLDDRTQIAKFSKGMKMKLAIAAAMCHGAKLLVLDEATSGLDPVVRNEILDMLLDFVQDEENSVFMSSHIISDLEKVCDYITFIKDGRIIFSAEKERLTEQYGVLRCSNSDFEKVDKSAVIAFNQNSFSTDALVHRGRIEGDYIIDKANVEDIMLYYMKEGKK